MNKEQAIEAMARAIKQTGGLLSEGFPIEIANSAYDALTANGMAIVPVETNQSMREAGVELAMRVKLSREYTWGDYMDDLYRAMIAAHLENNQ